MIELPYNLIQEISAVPKGVPLNASQQGILRGLAQELSQVPKIQERLARFAESQAHRAWLRLPAIALCGAAESGKDAAALFLSANTRLRFQGSVSRFVSSVCWSRSGGQQLDARELYSRRRLARRFWYELCNELRREQADWMIRLVLASADIVSGVRAKAELLEGKKEAIDLAIWIENPRGQKDDTCEVTASDCDITIVNDDTLEVFHTKLLRFATGLGHIRKAS